MEHAVRVGEQNTLSAIDTTSHTRDRPLPADSGNLALLACFAAAMVLACLIYEPWRTAPFSIVDFSEFLPLLTRNDSFGARLIAFVNYYSTQGRFNVVVYVYLVSEWSLFGWNAAAWHLSRFAEMCGIAALSYVLLLRMTGSRIGAAAGASLYFVASCAAPAWIRLSTAEVIGMWPLLGGALLATRYQCSQHWRASATAIAVLAAFAVLSKEVLIVFVPLVVLLAWTYCGPDHFVQPRASRRNLWLACTTAAAITVPIILILIIAARAHGPAYALAYGHAPVSMARSVGILLGLVLPTFSTYAPFTSFALPANMVFLIILAAGWTVSPVDTGLRRSHRSIAACLMAISVIGTLVYSPWPLFNFFYGLPYLIVPAALLAFAIKTINRHWPRRLWVALSACALILAQAAAFAAYDARHAFALREVNGALVKSVATRPATNSLIVTTKAISELSWIDTGPTLGRFVAALYPSRTLLSARSVSCETMRAGNDVHVPRGSVLITYADDCGTFPHPAWSERRVFSYFYWPALSLRQDSIRVDMLAAPASY